MAIYLGNQKSKFYLGSQKVKGIYLGGVKVYSSGNICTYTVRGVNYTQEYKEGQDVLHPTVVKPSLSGATFLGWSTSPSSTTTVSSLVMGDSPIHLYSVFKYADVGKTVLPESTNNHAAGDGEGYNTIGTTVVPFGWVYSSQLYSPINIDTGKYSAATIYGASLGVGFGWRLTDCYGALQVGNNVSGYMWSAFERDDNNSINKYFPQTVNISAGQGIQKLSVRFTVSGGYLGNARANYIMSNNDNTYRYSLTGRTVVG